MSSLSGISRVGRPKPKRPNAVRRVMNREEQVRNRAAAAAATAAAAGENDENSNADASTRGRVTSTSVRLKCPNKNCPGGKIINGTCTGCGVVVDDSNIVAEVQFGETSSGAAIVQGSYLGADQGGVRPAAGSAFRRVAGGTSETRERTFREIKQLIGQFARQLRISESLAESGFRNYKMASIDHNFTQGRLKNNVAAMCLYAACRREQNCKVMLIDLADLVRYDVFKLGKDYKEFLNRYPQIREGIRPIIMEDLIFRFASKLEFGRDTNKVALSAVRIAQRMQYDEMTHGRKPAGICGAALIMAARAHNYRRTVREVVYIAKVTMHTLQARMEEFSNVPSAQMSVHDFSSQAFLEAHHDPPLVYKRSREWQEKHRKPEKRKRSSTKQSDGAAVEGQDGSKKAKKQKATSGNVSQALSPSTSPVPQSATDKDGFVIPPRPVRPDDAPAEADHENAIIQTATVEGEEQLDVLAEEYGDSENEEEEEDAAIDPSSEMAMAIAQGIEVPAPSKKGKGKGKQKAKASQTPLPITQEWAADEAALEDEMEHHLNDPTVIAKSQAALRDEREQLKEARKQRQQEREAAGGDSIGDAEVADLHESSTAEVNGGDHEGRRNSISDRGWDQVSSSVNISPDEFKDDPEVLYCLLSEQEVKIKELIWANHNKDYMRQLQQKVFSQKMDEKKPKPARTRKKKSVPGDGITPASTPGEAAANAMNKRGVSMRINYDFDSVMFMSKLRGPGSMYGGATSVGSRSEVTSRAASVDGGSEAGSGSNTPRENAGPPRGLRSPSPEAANDENEEGGGGDGDGDGEDGQEAGGGYGGYDDGEASGYGYDPQEEGMDPFGGDDQY